MNQEPSLKEISSINPDSKFAQVVKMLSSGKGATVDELVELTDWKKHTVRARLSNLRNKYAINLDARKIDGKLFYRLLENQVEATTKE
jgi:transcription initiation factor IIE alpha subunit